LYTRGANRMCFPTIFCYCLLSTSALSSGCFIKSAVSHSLNHLILTVFRDLSCAGLVLIILSLKDQTCNAQFSFRCLLFLFFC
jgi:hypothetical protein